MPAIHLPTALQPDAVKLPPGYNQTYYSVPGWRRSLYAFAFLLLLPFCASLPIMLLQRTASEQWTEVVGLFVLAVFAIALLALIAIQIRYCSRAHVNLDGNSVKFRLPTGPKLQLGMGLRQENIRYDEIQAVELRSEVLGGTIAPVLQHGAHIITADGRDIALGYVRDNNSDSGFPFPLIARQIAQRAGVRLSFDPHVWRTISSRNKASALGVMPGVPHALSEADMAGINQGHRRKIFVLANFAVLLIVVGIAMDLASN